MAEQFTFEDVTDPKKPGVTDTLKTFFGVGKKPAGAAEPPARQMPAQEEAQSPDMAQQQTFQPPAAQPTNGTAPANGTKPESGPLSKAASTIKQPQMVSTMALRGEKRQPLPSARELGLSQEEAATASQEGYRTPGDTFDPYSTKEVLHTTIGQAKEVGAGAMTGAIGMGLVTNPVSTVIGVLTFMGLDEAKNAAVSKIKKEPWKFQEGKGVADLIGATGLTRDAIEATEFVLEGAAAGKGIKGAKSIFGDILGSIKGSKGKVEFANKVAEDAKTQGITPDEAAYNKRLADMRETEAKRAQGREESAAAGRKAAEPKPEEVLKKSHGETIPEQGADTSAPIAAERQAVEDRERLNRLQNTPKHLWAPGDRAFYDKMLGGESKIELASSHRSRREIGEQAPAAKVAAGEMSPYEELKAQAEEKRRGESESDKRKALADEVKETLVDQAEAPKPTPKKKSAQVKAKAKGRVEEPSPMGGPYTFEDVAEEPLRPAVKVEGEVVEGEPGSTHPETMKEEGIKPDADHERGFTRGDGEFENRAQAKKDLKENEPDIYAKWEKVVKDRGEDPETSELHAEDLKEATDATRGRDEPTGTVGQHKGTDSDGAQSEAGGSDIAREPEGRKKEKEKVKSSNTDELYDRAKKNTTLLDDQSGSVAIDLLTPGLQTGMKIAEGGKKIFKTAETLVLPTNKSPEHLAAGEVLGAKLGTKHRSAEMAAESFRPDGKWFIRQGVHNPNIPLDSNHVGMKFASDVSMGRKMTGRLKEMGDKVNKFFDGKLKQLESVGASIDQVRENYFPGMWKEDSRRAFNKAMDETTKASPELAEKDIADWTPQERADVKARVRELMKGGEGSDKDALAYLTKKPFKGKESFRKPKVFDDIMTGVDFGLEPISPNPIDLVLLKGEEMDRSIMANGALRDWEAKGDVINVNNSGRPLKKALQADFDPNEWEKVNDKYGTIWTMDPDTHLPEKVGYRMAKKPVADVLNNYLSSSFYNSPYFGTAYKGWMALANMLNQFQLGVGSAFHAGFTSMDVQISAGANVLKDGYGLLRGNRSVGDMAKSIGKFTTAMISNPKNGGRILEEWRTPSMEVPTDVPLNQLPSDKKTRIGMVAKALELAGGQLKMEQGLRTHVTDAMLKNWYSGGKGRAKAIAESPFGLVELTAKPIMEWLVPRQKAGIFGDFVGRIIEMNPDKTMKELTPQFRQAWNRDEARLGQVGYDRLFMNNVTKNVIQAMVRAPGWTGGTIAELGGAPKDFAGFFKEWAKTGKMPENIPDRVAYTTALLTLTTLTNGLMTYAFTGDKPTGMDYWAFRTGGVDEKGRPERFVLPSYAKDLFAYYEDWGHTILAKTHPIIGLAHDIWANRDYYGVKIRNEDDDWIQKWLIDTPSYGLKQFVPFWMRGAAKETERGGGFMETLKTSPQKLLAPQLGVMPATSAYTMTPFEKYGRKVFEEHGMAARTRTKEQAEKSTLKAKLERGLRLEDPEALNTINDYKEAGMITESDAKEIKRNAKTELIAKATKNMSIDELYRGIKYANDEEKRKLAPIFKKKLHNQAGKISPDKKREYLDMLEALQEAGQ